MKRILPAIVISQFLCTSLWFAGNAILPDIIKEYGGGLSLLADLTTAVQFGFIAGTLVFAVLSIADRFSPSRVFFTCAIIAAIFNSGICINGIAADGLLIMRFFTGFFLAGIYPVGMKIASDHTEKGLGKLLGFLVGALVLGTAFPHLLKSLGTNFPWKYVILTTSALAVLGGAIMLFYVPDGPYRKQGQQLKPLEFMKGFRDKNMRAASIGYFGHMWELYTFWAFVPVMLTNYNATSEAQLNVPLLSFLIIASGSVACVLGGYLAQYFGAKKIAGAALFLSGACCLLSPFFLQSSSAAALIIFLFFWGMVVIADSPLFSTLVAQHAPEATRGTSLTLVTCIGFLITVISIQATKIFSGYTDVAYVYLLLAIGPVAGLIGLRNLKNIPKAK